MAAIINAIVALAINVIALFLPEDALDLFWTFFSFSLVTLLISFLPLFPAFAKLRKIDSLKTDPKIYTISGGKFKLWTYTWIPFILLILGIFFTLFPEFNMAMFEYQWPLLAGVVLAIIIGELLAAKSKNKRRCHEKIKFYTKKDGFRMPAEFEKHRGTYIIWPERPDNWRNSGKPAQRYLQKLPL